MHQNSPFSAAKNSVGTHDPILFMKQSHKDDREIACFFKLDLSDDGSDK